MAEQTVQIDCAPGTTRPDVHMEAILILANMEDKTREPVGCFFGEWTYDFSDLEEFEWKLLSKRAKEYLTSAYHMGQVRFASW